MSATAAKLKKADDLATLVRRQQRAIKAGKRSYARADALLEQLLKSAEPGTVIKLDEHTEAVIVDNYPAGVLKAFRAHGIARYEVKVSEK